MKRVRILKPVDGYEIGDTPEMIGAKVRELVLTGKAERVSDDEEADNSPAKKPARRRSR